MSDKAEQRDRFLAMAKARKCTPRFLKEYLQGHVQKRKNCHRKEYMIIGLLADQIDGDGDIENVLPNFLESIEGRDYETEEVLEALGKFVVPSELTMMYHELGYMAYVEYCRLWAKCLPTIRAANKIG